MEPLLRWGGGSIDPPPRAIESPPAPAIPDIPLPYTRPHTVRSSHTKTVRHPPCPPHPHDATALSAGLTGRGREGPRWGAVWLAASPGGGLRGSWQRLCGRPHGGRPPNRPASPGVAWVLGRSIAVQPPPTQLIRPPCPPTVTGPAKDRGHVSWACTSGAEGGGGCEGGSLVMDWGGGGAPRFPRWCRSVRRWRLPCSPPPSPGPDTPPFLSEPGHPPRNPHESCGAHWRWSGQSGMRDADSPEATTGGGGEFRGKHSSMRATNPPPPGNVPPAK